MKVYEQLAEYPEDMVTKRGGEEEKSADPVVEGSDVRNVDERVVGGQGVDGRGVIGQAIKN